MKRSSSDLNSPSPASSPAPVTPNKKVKAENTTSSPAAPSRKKAKTGAAKEIQGEWTPEKKACFLDEIISAGMGTLGIANMAEKYGMTKTQISNAIQSRRKSNLRDKAVQAVKF